MENSKERVKPKIELRLWRGFRYGEVEHTVVVTGWLVYMEYRIVKLLSFSNA